MWLQKSVRIRGSVELINIIHSDGLANSLSLPSIYILYIAVELNLNALISSHLLRTRSAIQRPVSVLYAINMTYLPALKISQTKVELMRYLHLSPSIYVLMAVCRAAFRTRSLVAVPRPLNSDLLTFTTTSGRDSSSLHLADLGEVAPERSLYTWLAVRLERFQGAVEGRSSKPNRSWRRSIHQLLLESCFPTR